MANRKVSIWKYVKVNGKWRYCRPVYGANHKIKPHWVRTNSHDEHHPEGNYYLQYGQDGKQVWKKIGPNLANAVSAMEFQTTYLSAVAKGISVQPQDGDKSPIMMSGTLLNYLEEYRLSKRAESYGLMKQTLEEFFAFCRKNILGNITRLDLLRYKAWLLERGRSDRTAGNKMLRVNQYLRTVMGLKTGEGVVTVRDAKYVELEPVVYDKKELEEFFKACTPFQNAVFRTLLMSGLRKQELESLTWEDVDFTHGTLRVRPKPGFSPKTWEERTIEIPAVLLEIISALPRKSQWVFANGQGNRYTHMWDDCNATAAKAGIKGAHPHKFRATYATKLLQSGVDLKTVQKLLGHKNLESTMRYLAKAQSAEVRSKVDAIWFDDTDCDVIVDRVVSG